MRHDGKKFLRTSAARIAESRAETRDAVVYDVLPASRVARVMIQGSSKLITAHYPLNWEQTPVWLKSKNAVTIRHTGGNRGRIELIGHGSYVPTGGLSIPESGLDDAVLSGCNVLALDPAAMYVAVTAGTYRITGVTYYLGAYGGTSAYMAMGDPAPMAMGDAIAMGSTMAWGVAIDPAPATPGEFRIDLIVVGEDGAVDYVKGDEATEPVEPSLPANHLKLGSILLFYGMTAVTQEWINRPWEEPMASQLVVTPEELIMLWTDPVSQNIEFMVKDQYGIDMSPPEGVSWWGLTVAWILGNGTLGGAAAPTPYSGIFGGTHSDLTYTRDKLVTDKSPLLEATLSGGPTEIVGQCFIELRDESGIIML
jgi:hypothetical protein